MALNINHNLPSEHLFSFIIAFYDMNWLFHNKLSATHFPLCVQLTKAKDHGKLNPRPGKVSLTSSTAAGHSGVGVA